MGFFAADLELFAHLVVKVFQQLPARLGHRLVDFKTEFKLKLVEGGFDFLVFPAALVDGGNALFKIDAAFNRTEDFVAGAKDAFEELELFGEQFIDAPVGFVLAVEEVDHDHVVLLAVAVAASNALFNPLGVPR